MKHAYLAGLLVGSALITATAANAATGPDYKGLWLSTPFPAMTVSADEPLSLDVAVHNAGLPPLRANLKLDDVPKGWTVAFVASDRPVKAVFVSPDGQTNVKLRVDPPKDVKAGTYHMEMEADAAQQSFVLPVDLTIGGTLPPKLAATVAFPALQGTSSSSFDYKITVNNESDRDAMVALTADAPDGFQVSFTESYGTQKLTSVPIKAGAKQDLKAKIELPSGIEAGDYHVVVHAAAPGADNVDLPLTLNVTGQPKLSLTTPDGRLSGHAYAGEEEPVDVMVENNGTAPAHNVKLASSEPNGWKIAFQPAEIDVVSPDQPVKVKALITPSSKAIAGDYMVTLRSNGDGASNSEQFRVTVMTSTMWGIVGVAVIAIALLVFTMAVVRYGRR